MKILGLATLFLSLPAMLHAQARGSFEVTSLLGQRLYAQVDNDSVAAAKAKLSGGAPAVADYLALSLAEAARRQYNEAVATDTAGLGKFPGNADLLLERGHRELGLREFAAAEKDLQRAVQVDPSKLEAHYHLGLALYFEGRFAEAAVHFGHARDLAKTDDSLIDCSNWLYVSLRRAARQGEAAAALARITPSVHNTEPHLAFYLKLLRFYQGGIAEGEMLPGKPAPGDTEAELAYNTISYGLGNWHLYNGNRGAALPLFKQAVAGEAWNSWGFVGSEVELSRR